MIRPWMAVLVIPMLSCSGSTGSPFADRQPCSSNAGCDSDWICDHGECAKLCNAATECPSADQDCEDGVCTPVANPECDQSSDCPPPDRCYVLDALPQCVGGVCVYQRHPPGTACNDGDACTSGDQCDSESICAGVARVCDDPPDNSCDGNDFVSYPSAGTCVATTGDCDYHPTRTDCSPDCNACLGRCDGVLCTHFNGGCRANGTCVPDDPPTCDYDIAIDGARCDRAGEAVGSQRGFCISGVCGDCSGPEDCTEPPTSYTMCFSPECTSGTCQYPVQVGETCAAQECADNFQTNPRTCNSSGDCPVGSGTDCGGFACNGNACGTGPCADDSSCATGFYCNLGACPACQASESVCNDGLDNDCDSLTDCDDGHCTGQTGCTCTTTEDPETTCDDGGDNDCDTNPDCDDPDCDGEPCGNDRVCSNNACLKIDGESCSDDDECESGACADNICCGTACDGDCEYCNSSGVCTNRSAGATDECDTCEACDVAGGSCVGISATDGKGCATPCSHCDNGSCAPRNNDADCPLCHYCETATTGACTAQTDSNGNDCTTTCSECDNGSCVARNDDVECDACQQCATDSIGNCETPAASNNGKDCNDDCTFCDNGTCANRGVGEFAECSGECQACTTIGGDCGDTTGDNGAGCNAECTWCDDGSCEPRLVGDYTECTERCESCTSAGGSCGSRMSEEGRDCIGECTYCSSAGVCRNRTVGSTDECSGQCQGCLTDGGVCGAITADDGTDCNDDCSMCSSGSCVARDDDVECGACRYCNTGATGACSAITFGPGKNCTSDCEICTNGVCGDSPDGFCCDFDAGICHTGDCWSICEGATGCFDPSSGMYDGTYCASPDECFCTPVP